MQDLTRTYHKPHGGLNSDCRRDICDYKSDVDLFMIQADTMTFPSLQILLKTDLLFVNGHFYQLFQIA